MKKLLVVLAAMMSFASVSQADILIEPYLGYEFGKATDPDGKTDGTLLGARLAYVTPVMLWVGVDATLGMSGKFKPDTGSDDDFKRTTLAGVVGIDFPILLRAWLAYGFTNEIDLDTAGDKLKGTSTKLGVGFTGLPFVSLNLEYMKETFDKFGDADSDAQTETYILSVSLPLEF